MSTEHRNILMSAAGYQNSAGLEESQGKGLHWTCDINSELPIRMRQSGAGSELPFTVPEMFMNAVRNSHDRPSIWVMRDGVKKCWSWNRYY